MKTDAIRPTVVEPGRLVQRVADAVRTQDWNSELQVRIQQGVPQIEADERMLRDAVARRVVRDSAIAERLLKTSAVSIATDSSGREA